MPCNLFTGKHCIHLKLLHHAAKLRYAVHCGDWFRDRGVKGRVDPEAAQPARGPKSTCRMRRYLLPRESRCGAVRRRGQAALRWWARARSSSRLASRIKASENQMPKSPPVLSTSLLVASSVPPSAAAKTVHPPPAGRTFAAAGAGRQPLTSSMPTQTMDVDVRCLRASTAAYAESGPSK